MFASALLSVSLVQPCTRGCAGEIKYRHGSDVGWLLVLGGWWLASWWLGFVAGREVTLVTSRRPQALSGGWWWWMCMGGQSRSGDWYWTLGTSEIPLSLSHLHACIGPHFLGRSQAYMLPVEPESSLTRTSAPEPLSPLPH